MDAKERQKWIDKLRTCSGTNAANAVNIKKLFLFIIWIHFVFSMSQHYQYQKYINHHHHH
jgi:hypothetical protein